MWIMLIALGALVIFGLAVYAGKLLMQLKQQRLRQEQAEKEHAKNLAKHDAKVYDSVIIIVRAMKEKQCELGEGSWRLSVLLESLKLPSEAKSEFPAIFDLYDAIKHHAILDARKQLPKQQRMKQDVERMSAEAKFTEQISAELDRLYDHAVAQKSALSG
ncbi:DUF2489 domain-containing protein [Thalassotalea euphylliae]|uniref:DUF2489 domain-containing protein n=1 Tax=Thalassotalea euphylliae TaxID=1655234 RepID=UPI003635AF0A